GEGEVTMVTSSSKKDPRNLVLPVRFQGNLLLEAKVDNVSPAGDAELVVSYKDFHLTVTNQVRDRVITITITDRLMRIMEGESVREEIAAGEDDFPLAGIGGEKFSVEIDRRGKIIKAQSPPPPSRSFPYMNFSDLLERIQPEFPKAELPVGASWSREVEVTVPGLGRPWDKGETWKLKLNSTFRGFKGSRERFAIIDLSGQFEQKPEPGEEIDRHAGLQSSFHALTGSFEFDIKNGRVLASHSRLKQELDILMAIDRVIKGKEIRVRIDDTMDITTRLIGSRN
ncbi:MAG: hypothetical protein RAO92_05475, partial [Candidatus Euphemobacter frigidus]|nr:hypothetical protein [Candidatus Euphemobacter frigidus]